MTVSRRLRMVTYRCNYNIFYKSRFIVNAGGNERAFSNTIQVDYIIIIVIYLFLIILTYTHTRRVSNRLRVSELRKSVTFFSFSLTFCDFSVTTYTYTRNPIYRNRLESTFWQSPIINVEPLTVRIIISFIIISEQMLLFHRIIENFKNIIVVLSRK